MRINRKHRVSLKTKWLNVMLHFSGLINRYKVTLMGTTGPKIIFYGFCLLLLEVANVLISLPAYVFIAPQEFAGGDSSAIKAYRLRRIVSLSVLAGTTLSVIAWILASFFGLVLFPGSSHAAVASWDFNTPLAYHYDTSKIQIIDGTAVFKASQTLVETNSGGEIPSLPSDEAPPTETPSVDSKISPGVNTTDTTTPAVELTPTPIIEPSPTTEKMPLPQPVPVPTPVIEPAPASAPAPVPTSPILLENLRSLFGAKLALAQTNSCSATLQTITPLLVTPFIKWTGFSEIANKNGGEIYYALSGDGGISWLYWNGSAWADTGSNNGTIASEINDHISTFPVTLTQSATGLLMFRATFISDCTHEVSLLSLTADYEDRASTIIGFVGTDTSEGTETSVVTSESDPAVIAVADSIAAGIETSTEGGLPIEIPVSPSSFGAQITDSTSLDTNAAIETPTDVSGTPSVGAQAGSALSTDTSVDTGITTPIAFSVHVVTKTTGTPGHTLYSIPGLFSLTERTDNGLAINVTGTGLQTTALSSSANVKIGDHIVVLSYDGSKLSLYVDGAISGTLSAPIVIAPPAMVSTSIGCVSAGFILEAISLAKINANYLQCANQPPQLAITEAAQKSDDGFIDIIYTATDPENDFISLPVYEYSTTGAFAGEEGTLTAASLDTEHDGTNGILAAKGGTAHTFVWNVKADLLNYEGNAYVRLRANDGLITGPATTFYPVHIDTKGPIISHLRIKQEKENNAVAISYLISDNTPPVSSLIISRSEDNGASWTDITTGVSGNTSNINTPADGVETKTVIWNASDDLANQEKTILLRFTTRDSFGNEGAITGEVDIDTRAPIGLSALAGVESNMSELLWHWSPVDDTNFNRYTITYGTDNDSVTNGSGAVSLWGPSEDSDLLLAGTDRTVITGLAPDTLYYVKITAYDDYAHERASVVASFRTQAETVEVGGGAEVTVPSSSEIDETGGKISGGITTGGSLPNTSTLPPIAPTGGFKISIEEEAVETGDESVVLTLTAGSDTALMLISNKSDLGDAALQDYVPTTTWDLCAGLNACDNGIHAVYVKFYTSFGVGVAEVSDTITLSLPPSVGIESKGSGLASAPPTPSASEGHSETTGDEGGGEGSKSESVGGEGTVESSNVGTSVGGSVSGGNGPLISLTTNENPVGAGNTPTNSPINTSNGGAVPGNEKAGSGSPSPEPSADTKALGNSSADRGSITSAFVPTMNSVLQRIPELKGLAESHESGVLAKPEVTIVKKSISGQTINFTGTGIPNAKIALFIHSDQVVVHTTDANEKGEWSFAHDQNDIELAPGEHTVFAVTYDLGSKVKSKPSVVSTFYVKKSPAAIILGYTNLPTTLLTLVVLLFGTLYIYSRRRNAKIEN